MSLSTHQIRLFCLSENLYDFSDSVQCVYTGSTESFPNFIPLNLEFSSAMVGPWFNRRDRSNLANRVCRNENCRGRCKLANENGIRFFSYETLQIATNNFSNLIGPGYYGYVFKGVLPDDGRLVAIKRFDGCWRFHPDRFIEMVEYVSHLRHTNLIQVIGCCLENDIQLLVTEYADNGSIATFLCDSTRSDFNWERRAGVCIGIAWGLKYLHEDINPPVIHRDIKPQNILLDANFVPKVADFDLGLFVGCNSRISVGGARTGEGTIAFGDSDTEDPLMLSRVVGTSGYVCPEYAFRGDCTKKVDVYAFGVAMLIVISGRIWPLLRDETNDEILKYARTLRKDGRILELVDPMLIDFPKDHVERFLDVALLCTHLESKQRPNMFEVVLMLYGVYKSNQEISQMSMTAVTVDPPSWFVADPPPEEADAEDGGMVDVAPSSSHSSTVLNWENAAHSDQGNTRAQSCEMIDVSSYFQRSIQKIKEFQTSNASNATSKGTRRMARTMVIRQVSMEAVYPPYLSGEYPPSNAFCSLGWE